MKKGRKQNYWKKRGEKTMKIKGKTWWKEKNLVKTEEKPSEKKN